MSWSRSRHYLCRITTTLGRANVLVKDENSRVGRSPRIYVTAVHNVGPRVPRWHNAGRLTLLFDDDCEPLSRRSCRQTPKSSAASPAPSWETFQLSRFSACSLFSKRQRCAQDRAIRDQGMSETFGSLDQDRDEPRSRMKQAKTAKRPRS